MSRIGKKAVTLPKGVELKLDGSKLSVKGPKGTLERHLNPLVTVKVDGGTAQVEIASDDRKSAAMQGLTRTLLDNMVTGVVTPFKKSLEISGVGYRAELKGKVLNLQVGLSHDVNYQLPDGVDCTVDKQTTVHLEGCDKELVGQAAAKIRSYRPTEPYKGKGIKYVGEQVRRKEGKTGSK